MKKRLALILLCMPLLMLAGCAMCCSPLDYAYPTYGGKWQRVDRENGRVGSLFTPEAGVRVDENQVSGETIIQGELIEGEIIQGEVIEGEMIPPAPGDGDVMVEPARLMVPGR